MTESQKPVGATVPPELLDEIRQLKQQRKGLLQAAVHALAYCEGMASYNPADQLERAIADCGINEFDAS